ncbi:MAG: sugar phosphate nucleotidyltransferase [Kiritimatiellaeota bacterium]|nr:sugar phosphate nucleotidyltransferase [Kiritimatiellota bacterium]
MSVDLFVPGRVCLFGEHSDWAGGHRRTNSRLAPGAVIIAGTNQGMYARCGRVAGELVVRSALPDGSRTGECRIPMDLARLHEAAAEGGFFSYAAGVAAYMLDFYGVGGIEIDNYRTTLPVRKGLSSSAAFCVLVARAFNQVYQLGLTTRAEMEAAYQGEVATPSRCGRMDQGCAYGQVPVGMTFDADRLGVEPLRPGGDFYLLVADLCGKKDTVRILSDLNAAYPFAKGARDEAVQRTLGAENRRVVESARRMIESGDAEGLGSLMTEAQRMFDESLMPVCEELKSPRLHAVLGDARLAEWVWGGKGVGSQGDGCVQFICKDAAAREALAGYLGEAYGMPCFNLDIRRPVSVRKAVIPVAGLGTRMFPYTKAAPKTFLPVVTPEGIAKPVIQVIVEEALSAGVEQVALVIQPEDEARFRAYFQADVRADTLGKLPQALREEAERLNRISKVLTFIPQHEAKGFGHAVMLAEKFVGGEPFLLMLGDHLFRSGEARSVARQIVERFQDFGDAQSVIGIYEERLERVKHYGAVRGEWVSEDTLQIEQIKEKPTEDEARMNLKMEHHGKPAYFCVNGVYVLRPDVFAILRDAAAGTGSQEIELTAALDRLRQREGVKGLIVNGRHFDTGLPAIYAETVFAFARGVAE